MDQMINQLSWITWMEIWVALTFQALEIPYLPNLIQMVVWPEQVFLQQSIMKSQQQPWHPQLQQLQHSLEVKKHTKFNS